MTPRSARASRAGNDSKINTHNTPNPHGDFEFLILLDGRGPGGNHHGLDSPKRLNVFANADKTPYAASTPGSASDHPVPDRRQNLLFCLAQSPAKRLAPDLGIRTVPKLFANNPHSVYGNRTTNPDDRAEHPGTGRLG